MTRKFRILMLSWEYPPHITGGLAVAVAGMARALAERGHRIVLVVPELHGDEPVVSNIDLLDFQTGMARLSGDDQQELTRFAASRENVTPALVYSSATFNEGSSRETDQTMHRAASRKAPRIRGGYGPAIQGDIRLFAQLTGKLAKHLEFDVVHAHDWVTFPAGQAAAVGAGVPLVCHVHATEFDRSGDHVSQAVVDIEREGFHAASLIIAVSRYTAAVVHERYGVPSNKIRVAHNSVEEGGIRDAADATSKYHRKRVVVLAPKKTEKRAAEYFRELEALSRTAGNPAKPTSGRMIVRRFLDRFKIWRKNNGH